MFIENLIYDKLRVLLPQRKRDLLKSKILKFQNSSLPFYKIVHGTFCDKDLLDNIISRMPVLPKILMVHSSINNLMPCYKGSPKVLLDLLLRFAEENNITLVMPTFSFFNSTEETIGYFKNHIFDVKKTISRMGLITELFRRKEGVYRSLHPTHSVSAYGPMASELTKNHHLSDTICGSGTPFEYMANNDTVILGIGTRPFRVLTQLHSAEHIMGKEFPVQIAISNKMEIPCIDSDGKTIPVKVNFEDGKISRKSRYILKIIRGEGLIEWKYKCANMFISSAKYINEQVKFYANNGITIYGNFYKKD